MGWSSCLQHCAEADGPVLLRDLARVGELSSRAVRARVRREGWWQPFPDVVGAPGLRVDDRARAIAAALHARGRTGVPERDLAAVTRWSALAILGLRRSAPTNVQVVIPACRWLEGQPGLTVIRSRLLRPSDLRDYSGIPLVTGEALVRDLALVTTLDRLRSITIDLLQKREASIAGLEHLLTEQRRFPGRTTLSRVVADLAAAGRTDSPLELEARERFRADGVPLDRGQVEVPLRAGGRIHLDLGIAAIRFGVEVESFAWHAARSELDRDALRSNAVTSIADDWRVFRLTWTIMTERWAEFLAEVRRTIAAQAQRHLGVPWPRPTDLRT